MTPQELLQKAQWMCEKVGVPDAKDQGNFLQYAEFVASIISDHMTAKQREKLPWLYEFVEGWKGLKDDFEAIVRADPMCLYQPKNHISEAFHKSQAFFRYFCAGNRTSKTLSGYAEDYWVVTGQHPYRQIPCPSNVGIVAGLPFKDYAPKVFEQKLIFGEAENPISPMFPEDGKWFNHYDSRKNILTIACKNCANSGKAQSCAHEKSHIYLFSIETPAGAKILEAFSARVMHYDENTPASFFKAGIQRMQGQKGAFMMATTTPLAGIDSWEEEIVRAKAEGNPKENRVIPGDLKSQVWAEVYTISQREAGISTKEEISRLEQTYDEFEIAVRIDGIPMPLAENPVFDRIVLKQLQTSAPAPRYGALETALPLDTLTPDSHGLELVSTRPDKPSAYTGHRIWEMPQPGAQYIAGVDTAAGLSNRDASCCNIFKMELRGMRPVLTQVAQFYGWVNTYDYGTEVFKLCTMYNDALAVIELTGGLGRAVLLRLKKDLMYWNVYRDSAGTRAEVVEFQEESKHGVDTNQATKPTMVAITQQMLKDKQLVLKDVETIKEMVAFAQEKSDSGKTVSYRGVGGSKDDRTMSTVIACAVAMSSPNIWEFSLEHDKIGQKQPDSPTQEIWDDLHKELAAKNSGLNMQEI
jgi:phage terminase large subunit-like protein